MVRGAWPPLHLDYKRYSSESHDDVENAHEWMRPQLQKAVHEVPDVKRQRKAVQRPGVTAHAGGPTADQTMLFGIAAWTDRDQRVYDHTGRYKHEDDKCCVHCC